MQKIRTCFFIATLLCLAQNTAFAEDDVDMTAPQAVEAVTPNTSQSDQEFDPNMAQAGYSANEIGDTSPTTTELLSEIIIRPVAVVASATGFVLFIVASPFSGLASIPEPHDAFKTTWDNFVVTPYYFAFRRPFGDYSVELN